MFARIDQQQHAPVLQVRHDAGHRVIGKHRKAKVPRDRRADARPIGDRREVDDAEPVGVGLRFRSANLDGNGCLADAARADNGDEPVAIEIVHQSCDMAIAAEYRPIGARQCAVRRGFVIAGHAF